MSIGVHDTWEVDYDKHTIKVTVRLDFYRYFTPLTIGETIVITDRIEQFWNFNHGRRRQFKCFDLYFKVDGRVAEGWWDIRKNAIGVEIVDRTEVRAHVWVGAHGNSAEKARSDDPDDRTVPSDGLPGNEYFHSRWSMADKGAFAHEFGHILGLDDSYEDHLFGDTTVKEGLTNDFMGTKDGVMAAETITRMVRRSGEVDESKMDCSLALDAGPVDWNAAIATVTGMTLRAWACDYEPPSDDPRRAPGDIKLEGTLSYSGSFLNVSGSVTLQLKGALMPVDRAKRSGMMWLRAVDHDEIFLDANYNWMPGPGIPYLTDEIWTLAAPSSTLGPPLIGRWSQGAKECKKK